MIVMTFCFVWLYIYPTRLNLIIIIIWFVALIFLFKSSVYKFKFYTRVSYSNLNNFDFLLRVFALCFKTSHLLIKVLTFFGKTKKLFWPFFFNISDMRFTLWNNIPKFCVFYVWEDYDIWVLIQISSYEWLHSQFELEKYYIMYQTFNLFMNIIIEYST